MTTNYHYDGDSIDVLYETNGDGKVVRQYVYSDDNVRLAMKMNGKTLYYHYNAHGDVIALTDEAGKIVAEYAYDAWGNVLKNTASTEEAKANPYGYAGYTYDKEIEQYYLMARYYEPEQGVFTAYDPNPGDEDDPQMMNGYNYANNNPVMYLDPDGEVAWWAVSAGVGAATGLAKYLWKNRKKGYSWKGALVATGVGAVQGVFKVGLGRVLGYKSIGKIGKKIWKAKSVKKGTKQVFHNVKSSIKSMKKDWKGHFKNSLFPKSYKKISKKVNKAQKKMGKKKRRKY